MVEFVLNIADDLLENVLHRGKAAGAAVFVHHDGDLRMLALEIHQQLARAACLRHEHRAAHKFAHRGSGAAGRVPQNKQILDVQNADYLVERPAVNRQARAAVFGRKAHRLHCGGTLLHADHLGAVRHYVARRHVVQLENIGDHFSLALVDQLALLYVVDIRKYVLLGHVRLRGKA